MTIGGVLSGQSQSSVRRGCHLQLFAETLTAPVRWRLLSANNREFGRGADSFANSDDCRAALRDIQESAHQLAAVIERESPRTWTWRILQDGHEVAIAARGYNRLGACQRALAHFRGGLSVATIGPALLVSHSRRWTPEDALALDATRRSGDPGAPAVHDPDASEAPCRCLCGLLLGAETRQVLLDVLGGRVASVRGDGQ